MTAVVENAEAGLALAELSAQLYARGWMEGTAGNISLRLADQESALITASGRSKGSLTGRDAVEVRIDGTHPVHPEGPRPSAETCIHAALYRLIPDCHAVVHAHPPYSTAIAAMAARRGASTVEFAGLELIKGLGAADPFAVSVPVFDNHAEVPRIADDITARLTAGMPPVLLIGAHGATAWGPTLQVARNHMECLEALCQLKLLIDRSRPCQQM